MHRRAEFIRLSHDHHRGLVLARRIRESLLETESAVDALRSLVLKDWEAVLIKHFACEEEFLGPPLRRSGRPDLADRLVAEHSALRALADGRSAMKAEDLRTFSRLLEEHIRFEERELFEEAQALLTEDELKALADATAQG